MKELLSFNQGPAHEEILFSLRSHTSNTGNIKVDYLLLSVFLNGFDPFFQRNIDQVLESAVPLTSQEVLWRFQSYT